MDHRKRNYIEPYPGSDFQIGRWLWAFQDARMRTMEEIARLTAAMIDWLPEEGGSSIGTVLYHLAAIEADWLYVEVLEQPFPAEVNDLFPYELRDGAGRLIQVPAVSLEEHLERLKTVRELVLDVYKQMNLEDFQRVRSLPDYDVTPEWVFHHLMQHEAEHRSQIGSLRERFEAKKGRK